jgi:hypothetical protein
MTKLVKAISFLIVLAIVGVIIYLSVDLAKQKGSVSPSASASPVPGATASPSASPSPAAAGPVVVPTEGKTGFGAGQIFGFSIATLLGLALLVVVGLFLVGAVGSQDRSMKGFREAGMANIKKVVQPGIDRAKLEIAIGKVKSDKKFALKLKKHFKSARNGAEESAKLIFEAAAQIKRNRDARVRNAENDEVAARMQQSPVADGADKV